MSNYSLGEMVTLTLKDQAIQFRTYNAKALKLLSKKRLMIFIKKIINGLKHVR